MFASRCLDGWLELAIYLVHILGGGRGRRGYAFVRRKYGDVLLQVAGRAGRFRCLLIRGCTMRCEVKSHQSNAVPEFVFGVSPWSVVLCRPVSPPVSVT